MHYPTRAELSVLRELWQLGTATPRNVRDALTAAGIHYASNGPSVILMRMARKGIVERHAAPAGTAGYVYTAAYDRKAFAEKLAEEL
jgi:predicted transcriptional regulator